jgi:sulfite reductase alpha subunit-like flavoprotein
MDAVPAPAATERLLFVGPSILLYCCHVSCSGELDPPFPAPISLATALAYFADLLSSPRKDALLGLASCATDEAQAARLKLLASPQGKAEYTNYIAKPHRSLLEVRRGRGWAK